MPYDKVVDSSKLDGAIKATADGIRETTSYGHELPWDEELGFYNPIIGLVTGAEENARQDGYSSGYSIGKEAGYRDGLDVGYQEGKSYGQRAEYDRFWDAYQSKGRRNMYDGAFAGTCWTTETFRPKYDIKNFHSAMSMFWSSLMQIDLPTYLESLGITLDFSNVTSMRNAFAYSYFTRLGVLDLSKASSASDAFPFMTKLVTIDKIIVSPDTMFTYWFNGDTALTHVIFEGTIAKNGLNLQWCPLDKESLTSIVNALSTTTSGLSVTLSKSAVNTAFETSAGAADGSTSAEWLALVATRSNWTISLV